MEKIYLIASSVVGKVPPPPGVSRFDQGQLSGMVRFINNIIKFAILIAGIYTLINLVLAGFAFLSAADDPKKMAGAWAKIWQSLVGLAITAGSFVLAGIFGKLVFNDWSALLQFRIITP